MHLFPVGPDTLSEHDIDETTDKDNEFHWFVYWYEVGSYDGSGEGVALHKVSGLLYYVGLGHCSCNGPIDGPLGTNATKYTPAEFFSLTASIYELDCRNAVKDKVKELLATKLYI